MTEEEPITPKDLIKCYWCRRSTCETLITETFRHKAYCCQCGNARTERAFGKGPLKFCKTCIPRPFVCRSCKRTDCDHLNWDYGQATDTQIACCLCYEPLHSAELDYEEKCERCQELDENEESSSSASRSEEEVKHKRDASPKRPD
jgi:hypothetical protein